MCAALRGNTQSSSSFGSPRRTLAKSLGKKVAPLRLCALFSTPHGQSQTNVRYWKRSSNLLVVPTVALAWLIAAVDTVCVWSWLCWKVFLSAVIGLLMVSCQPRRPPPPQPSAPSEPHFLPTLPGPQIPSGIGSTASRAEQWAAFTAAEALRTSGQPLQARQAFADFVRRYPDSDFTDDALLALGHISATLEQYAQAVTYYRSLLERFPRSERAPEAHLGLGVALYYRQDYPHSLTEFRYYLRLAPEGASQGLARYYLGATALKQQRY